MPTQSQSQSHSRKSSLSGFFSQHTRKSSKSSSSTKHQRTNTAPDPPTLSRLPSVASTAPSVSSRSRRASNPSTPTAPVSAASTTSATAAASYFAPQPVATGQDPRSPGTRRPPASHSGHGIDNSRGPPVALVTRGNSDIARRSSTQKPADFAYAQQQFVQSGLVSPGSSHGGSSRRRRHEAAASDAPQPQPQQTSSSSRIPSRRGSTATATVTATSTSRPARPMTSSVDDSSEYESGPRSQAGDIRSGNGATDSSSNDDEQTEDLFLNIAADTAPAKRPTETPARIDRLKSRLARVNDRQSQSSGARSPAPATSSTTPTTTRIASTTESKTSSQRRPPLLPTTSRTLPERSSSPSPAAVLNTPRTRAPDLSHKPSFSRKDAELSPRDFLAQFQRRPSQSETVQTPPQRSATYRPSNLYYSSSRDDPRTLPADAALETTSRPDGTESVGSTGPAASVWDELDELKTRIRKIEMGGKMPATSGAAVSQASADRPRTANTSATTVSSSPNQQRKGGNPPSEGTVESQPISNNKIQPILRDALAKARQNISPSIYRILEATASEALTLAEMSGSAGPQGTLHSANSILSGSVVSDRQVRRKADNICRSLTELCIAMCDTKTSLASPVVRTAATISRRPSVQINGDSPTIRQSIEPESNTLQGVSPSRALSRIEARRTSQLAPGASGSLRNGSQEPYEDRDIPSRLSRAGTSMHRTRGSFNDEEEDPTMRAPSRAMTDFRTTRTIDQNRFSSGRQYTSREPMPELQPSPALRPTSALRRPTVAGIAHESSLLYRDAPRRYELHRESSPAYEKQAAGNIRARAQLNVARNPNNRNSIGGMSDLGRSVSLGRRLRGSSIGE